MKFSTHTINQNNEVVPWLAATGELAYSPASPPSRDYYFLYNFTLPGIFDSTVNLRQHYYFGDYAGKKDFYVEPLLKFWEQARHKSITPLLIYYAPDDFNNFESPIAIFKYACPRTLESYFLFIQHGSYLFIPEEEQPLLESSGHVLLYRGIGTNNKFSIFNMPKDLSLIDTYRKMVVQSFSDSVLSFNTAHAPVRRTETSHLQSEQDIFTFIPILSKKADKELNDLLINVNQCYTFSAQIAKNKFGPSYATFKTPVTNLRICTYFAGEYETRILSLDKLIPIETTKCDFIY
jgi:hypothetical protein